MESNKFKAFFGLARLGLGLLFLWAFFDKVFGLGFATMPADAWITGGSPTAGFLQMGVHGPFTNFYHALSVSGGAAVDWVFMLGLLFVGVSLTFGIFTKLGSFAAMLMLILMYTAEGLLPEHHPFLDEHIIYFLLAGMIMFGDSGRYFGFGNLWYRTSLVQKYSILR